MIEQERVTNGRMNQETLTKSISQAYDPSLVEKTVRSEWKEHSLRQTVEEKLQDSKQKPMTIGYVEGPPTMNGEPHIGHVRGRIIKDLWYRFATLQGKRIVFRAGWDTQGLPVELQAERELGLTGSKAENLRRVGMETLVAKCKELIAKYNTKWRLSDEMIGLQLDYDNAYWTYKDNYIEREWNYLKRAYEKGIMSEGLRIVAYCPSCQTAVSHAEIGQGYETVEDPSVYFKMKLKDEDASLVIWTTMPFTVITDELVGVKPTAEYVYVRVGGKSDRRRPKEDQKDRGETWIVAKERLPSLAEQLNIKDYEVLKTLKGKELEGKKYDYPLLKVVIGQRNIDRRKGVHTVVAEEFVDSTTGSGLVHLSPANGEDDYAVATKRGIVVFSPIDDQVKFTKDAGRFAGMFVRDTDEAVASLLKERGLLISQGSITHEYPCCWRSHHKLVWLLRREYFYWVDRLGDKGVKAAEGVEYFYDSPKNRFLEIVKEKVPWCISRERVWGAPIPIWVCGACKEKIPAFSRKEIIEKAIELPDGPNFELHRPWIDRVKLKCPKCSSAATREQFVLDTWHNSGAAPFASFSNKEYSQLVPVEFLTEGIDQTRGWAYTLLIENVILTGKAQSPYRKFLFQGLVVDEKGAKLSKSLGNYIEGIQLLNSFPVDVLRFYLLWKSSPVDQLAFSEKELMGRPFQILNTLYHLHVYLDQNSKYDGFDNKLNDLNWALTSGEVLDQDRWVLSRLQRVIDEVTKAFDSARYHEAARALENFIINDVSQGYLPIIRSDLWSDDPATLTRRLTIFTVLNRALTVTRVLLHPFSPFMTDYLNGVSTPASRVGPVMFTCDSSTSFILISSTWPQRDESLENPTIENTFGVLFSVLSLANSARSRAKLKRRWPLKEAVVVVKEDLLRSILNNVELVKDLLNVQSVKITSSVSDAAIGLGFGLNKKSIADRGGDFRKIASSLRSTDPKELYRKLRDGSQALVDSVEVLRSDVELTVEQSPNKSGAANFSAVVVLDTLRDSRLIAQGLLRDLARQLQALRKKKGFRPVDVLEEANIAGLTVEQETLLRENSEHLAFLVRAKRVTFLKAPGSSDWEKMDIDGREVFLEVR